MILQAGVCGKSGDLCTSEGNLEAICKPLLQLWHLIAVPACCVHPLQTCTMDTQVSEALTESGEALLSQISRSRICPTI